MAAIEDVYQGEVMAGNRVCDGGRGTRGSQRALENLYVRSMRVDEEGEARKGLRELQVSRVINGSSR